MTNGDDRRAGRTDDGRLRRSRQDRMVGGVCAGVAHHLGVDPAVVRLVALLLIVISGGTAVLIYAAAWVLLPRGDPDRVDVTPVAPIPRTGAGRGDESVTGGVRAAWRTAGTELRTLAGGLRPTGPLTPDVRRGTTLSPLDRADAAATALGDRLRDPQVQADARRAATSLSTALGSTVDDVARRTRRAAPPSGPTG